VNIVPGASTDQSAYRSEVAGLFGIATMVREICALHDITAGTVYLGCDGLSALLNCTDIDYVVKPTAPHFDLITATRAMLQQCPVKWIPHHVLGHQDDDLMHSLTDGRLSILRWTKTLKCIGPKPLTSLATVNSRFPGTLALWWKDKKVCMNLHSTYTLLLADRQVFIKKHGKFGHGTYWILIEGHGQSYG
jgi:hypothetical protein